VGGVIGYGSWLDESDSQIKIRHGDTFYEAFPLRWTEIKYPAANTEPLYKYCKNFLTPWGQSQPEKLVTASLSAEKGKFWGPAEGTGCPDFLQA